MPPQSSSDTDANGRGAEHEASVGIYAAAAAAAAPQTKVKGSSSFLTLSQQSARAIPQIRVSLEDVSYTPATAKSSRNADAPQGKRTTVLNKVNAQINPFELTGWMGPSGSGKTSLASVVANLVDPSDVTGTVRVNRDKAGGVPKQMVGVVWQDDLLLGNLTAEETVYFAARLRTPSAATDGAVRALTEEALRELGLLRVRSRPVRSLSGGERRRVAVAQELVARPSLLLLDEPTSGLDATAARELCRTLGGLASLGHAVALVVHQPRTDIFAMLDRLLLLSRGRVVYEGDPRRVRAYLEAVAGPLPPETGIADWIMDTIVADERMQEESREGGGSRYVCLADHWEAARSAFRTKADDAPGSDVDGRPRSPPGEPRTVGGPTYEASFWKELSLLAGRTSKQQRGEKLTRISCALTLTYLVFTAFMYFRLPNDTANVFERNSLIFFLLIAQGNGIVSSCIAVFNRERDLLRRERARKMYRVLPYFLAKCASDMTNNILLPTIYGIAMYWTAGLRPSAAAFVRFLLGYYLTLSCAQSMGFFLSILYPNMAVAMILAPPITLFMFISGGFYIPFNNMHVAMRVLSYVSFARYGYSALLINEYGGRLVPCYENDGSDGEEFTGITIGGSSECPLPGDSIYESIGIDGVFANYWFNVGMVAIFQTTFLVGAYALLRRSK